MSAKYKEKCTSRKRTERGTVLRIRDVNPGSRIQKQQQMKGARKKLFLPTLFCSHKCHKIENYFIFELVKKKKFGPNYREL
jgi:hypothetical protein